MATTVTYKGETLATVRNDTKTLKTGGTWVEGDIGITDETGTAVVAVEDVPDSHGGIEKRITAVDISDTDATASDVAQGKVFYSNTGTRTTGTGAIGGWSVDGIGQGIEPYGVITYNPTTMVESAFNQNGNTRNQSGITDFYAPNLLSVPTSAFKNARHLLTASFPVATEIKGDAFNYATLLESLYIPNVQNINSSYVIASTQITTIVLPSVTSAIGNDCLRNNSKLTTVDIGPNCAQLNARCFNTDPKLEVLILRNPAVLPLTNESAFTGTPYTRNGTGGEIYVPQALLSTYPTATNWSTVDGYGTITWKAIEGSYYETHYADGSEVTA